MQKNIRASVVTSQVQKMPVWTWTKSAANQLSKCSQTGNTDTGTIFQKGSSPTYVLFKQMRDISYGRHFGLMSMVHGSLSSKTRILTFFLAQSCIDIQKGLLGMVSTSF